MRRLIPLKQMSAAGGAFVAVLGMCVFTAPAQAATPAWKLLAATGPTNLPPEQSEVQRAAVEAEGGTFRLGFEGKTAQQEMEVTPVVIEAHLTLTAGSNVATIEGVG